MTLKFSLSSFPSVPEHSSVSGVLTHFVLKHIKLKQTFPDLAISKELRSLRKVEISRWMKSSQITARWRHCAWMLQIWMEF